MSRANSGSYPPEGPEPGRHGSAGSEAVSGAAAGRWSVHWPAGPAGRSLWQRLVP